MADRETELQKIKEAHKKRITIDREEFVLILWTRDKEDRDFDVEKIYPIAVGMDGYATPATTKVKLPNGETVRVPRPYMINTKARNPDWRRPNSEWVQPPELRGTVVPGGSPDNPLGPRWLGVTSPEEGIGIHGTNNPGSIGTAASHGCIRMLPDDVIELYDKVPIGTPVHIHN